MGSKCGTRTRAREREEIIPSPCRSERSERAVCQEWRQDFSFPPGPRPHLLFSYLASLVSLSLSYSFSSPFSLSVSLRPLSYGNDLTLPLSPSHSRGEEPSIQFYPQPLGRAVSTTGTEINNLGEEVHSSNWLHSSR